MGPIRVQTEVDAPRERVFDYLSDLANRPAFTEPYLTSFRLERIESRGVGAAARFQARPGSAWTSTQIEQLDSPHRIVERGRTGRVNRVPTTTVWELIETPGGVTRVTVTFFTQPNNPFDRAAELGRRASRGHRRGWQHSLRNLREVFESDAAKAPRIRVAGGNRYATGIA